MAEPTDEQLREYAAKLPQIYKDVLAAFPLSRPKRKRGGSVNRSSIVMAVLRGTRAGGDAVGSLDVREALHNLKLVGIVEVDEETRSITPTELGERLITILTGHEAKAHGVPPLPAVTW